MKMLVGFACGLELGGLWPRYFLFWAMAVPRCAGLPADRFWLGTAAHTPAIDPACGPPSEWRCLKGVDDVDDIDDDVDDANQMSL